MGEPSVVRPALQHDGARDADVPRQPDPQLLRRGPGADRASHLVEVPCERRSLSHLDGPARCAGVVRHRLDWPGQRLDEPEGQQAVARVRRVRRGVPLPRPDHRPADASRLPDGRHRQGLGHRRPRWLSPLLRGITRQQPARRSRSTATPRPSCGGCLRMRCHRRCGTTTGTARRSSSTTTCSRAARTASSTS